MDKFADVEVQEIDEIFKFLWKLQIFNVNVMFKSENGKNLVKTFMPLSFAKQGELLELLYRMPIKKKICRK